VGRQADRRAHPYSFTHTHISYWSVDCTHLLEEMRCVELLLPAGLAMCLWL